MSSVKDNAPNAINLALGGFIYPSVDKTYTFEYNVGGNIISKNEYVYTEGMIEGESTKTYAYTYGNAWKDQLTGFDGSSVVYDASGNPTSYLGSTLTWSRGRLLTQYVSGPKTVAMQYNANGIRMSKQTTLPYVNANTTYKYDSRGRLRTETQNGVTRRYLYSSNGIEGYEQDGERFLYRKNLFGDITAIYQGTTKVAEYTYDAWGNCTIILDTEGYGTRNPFRYRGYYWEEDLKMYYLMTRYYDPQTGRFINADGFEYLEPNKINGLNLYAYCRDNPVMLTDPQGTAGAIVWLVALCVGVGALVGGIMGYLMDSPFGSNIDISNTKLPQNGVPNSTNLNEDQYIDDTTELSGGERALNALKGALLGAWTGAMTSMVLGVGMTLYGAATGAGALIPSGIGTFALGHALTLFFSPILFATGIKVDIVDEDPTKKYETGLPQFK